MKNPRLSQLQKLNSPISQRLTGLAQIKRLLSTLTALIFPVGKYHNTTGTSGTKQLLSGRPLTRVIVNPEHTIVSLLYLHNRNLERVQRRHVYQKILLLYLSLDTENN